MAKTSNGKDAGAKKSRMAAAANKAASKKKKIGVFATPFTISTEAHKKAILAADSTAEVYPMGCAKFVPLIEGEQFASPELPQAIAEYAAPLKEAGVDALILSCTH